MDELEAQLATTSSNALYPSNAYASSPPGVSYAYAYSPLAGGSSAVTTPSVDQNDPLALAASFSWPSGVKRSHAESGILSHGSVSPSEPSKRQKKRKYFLYIKKNKVYSFCF